MKSIDILLENSTITWLDDATPCSMRYQDIYYSKHGGLAEKHYVFIEGNQLMSRFIHCKESQFTIMEFGFGTGLNFLVAWQTFQVFRHRYPEHLLTQLNFISIEAYPFSKEELYRTHQQWPTLLKEATQLQQQWPTTFNTPHQFVLEKQIILTLWIDDVNQLLSQHHLFDKLAVNCWFLDGFSPLKNPEMWSELLFQFMANHSLGHTTFATYSCARQVREGLEQVGFIVEKRKGFAQKREMLCGFFSPIQEEG